VIEGPDHPLIEVSALAKELRARWQRDGVSFRAGATPAEIAAFEERHLLRLPDEVRAYLKVVNGMADRAGDDELLEFLSLERMSEELERFPTEPRSVALVDYLTSSEVFGVRATLEPAAFAPIYSLGERAERQVFASFAELLRVHLHDRNGIVGR
jgi:hypothetical protein